MQSLNDVLAVVFVIAALAAAFSAGFRWGKMGARETSEIRVELARNLLDHSRREGTLDRTISSALSESKTANETLEKFSKRIERMDESMGRMADILVQTGRARMMSMDDLATGSERAPWPERVRGTEVPRSGSSVSDGPGAPT